MRSAGKRRSAATSARRFWIARGSCKADGATVRPWRDARATNRRCRANFLPSALAWEVGAEVGKVKNNRLELMEPLGL